VIRNREQRRKGQTSKSLPCFSASSRATHSSKSVKGAVAMAEGSHTRRGPTTDWTYMLWFREKAASACASPSVPAILGGGMSVREEVPWDDLFPRRALGDAGMWALVPLLLLLGGGFLLFISIFAGEFLGRWEFFVGGFAVVLGLAFAALMGARGCIVAPVLIVVGVFGGWVWEQFRDGASIDAVTHVGNYDYLGPGYDGSQWAGRVHNYEERTATVTCQLEVLSPEGDVIATVDLTATDVRPNGGQYVEGDIDVPSLTEAAAQAERIQVLRNVRGTCTSEIG